MTISDIVTTLIYEGGLNIEYVMNEMQIFEIQPFIDKIYKKNKENWEQTRMLAYVIAQTQSTKKLKITDILSFPWDGETTETQRNTSVTNEQKAELMEKAKLIEKIVNKNG